MFRHSTLDCSRLANVCSQEYEAALRNAQVSRSTTPVEGPSFVAGASTKADSVSVFSYSLLIRMFVLIAFCRRDWFP